MHKNAIGKKLRNRKAATEELESDLYLQKEIKMSRISKFERERIEKFTTTARRFCAFYPDLQPYAYDPGYVFSIVRTNDLLYSVGTLELPEWFVEFTVELLEKKCIEDPNYEKR